MKVTKIDGLFLGVDYVIMPGKTLSLDIIKGDVPQEALGGFHTLCADVGEITGHPLNGYHAGDILPQSLWSEHHRPACPDPRGLVYDPVKNLWVRIYLEQDKKGLLNLSYDDFVSYGTDRGWRLLSHEEFITAAEGSNEMTNIKESRRPNFSGGHVDQVGRRMVSNIGCEDCCGVLWQYLSTSSLSYPDSGLLAGGYWYDGSACGSRYRHASYYRWYTYSYIGARFVSEPLYPKSRAQ